MPAISYRILFETRAPWMHHLGVVARKKLRVILSIVLQGGLVENRALQIKLFHVVSLYLCDVEGDVV